MPFKEISTKILKEGTEKGNQNLLLDKLLSFIKSRSEVPILEAYEVIGCFRQKLNKMLVEY